MLRRKFNPFFHPYCEQSNKSEMSKTRRADHSNFVESGLVINGSHNSIKGSDCLINGHHNIIFGSNCTVTGHHNKIYGSNCYIDGDHTGVYGRNCEVNGDHTRSYISTTKMHGSHCHYMHEDEKPNTSNDYSNVNIVCTGSSCTINGKLCKINGHSIELPHSYRSMFVTNNVDDEIYFDSRKPEKGIWPYRVKKENETRISRTEGVKDFLRHMHKKDEKYEHREKYEHGEKYEEKIKEKEIKEKERNLREREERVKEQEKKVKEKIDDEDSEKYSEKYNKKYSDRDSNKNSDQEEHDDGLCVVCMDNPYNVVFVKCGHICACEECAKKLPDKQCPVCRMKGKFRKIHFA
jgi:hypothetical protein